MSTCTPCPILVINLRSSTARWEKVSAELASTGLLFERHEAVDGRLFSAAEIAQLAPWDSSAFFKPLSPGEIGCFLSHVSAAERIVREGWNRALWPAAQTLRLICSGAVHPVSTAGIQSQCSTKL